MKGVVLAYGKGETQQYAAARRREAIDKMIAVTSAHVDLLIQVGLVKACATNEAEFVRHIGLLRLGAMELDLRIERRYIPAVIMIPNARVSLQQKLMMLGVEEVVNIDGEQKGIKTLEPYAAINVTLKKVDKSEILTGINGRFAGVFPRMETMSLSEVVMLATYYPALFDGFATVITDPEMESVFVLEGSREEKSDRTCFTVTEGSRRDLSWMTWKKYQVPLCEVRVGR
ncbi:MAG: hypothetical protein UX49_C0018G0018 [Candidatus Wolfebacteria bacterium GW2011_GWC2_46_275]|uniref:Uncharacterized protein n=2 Tax=Candidatus Wolfeibacteriota TaxID=1752735 RepID=A0A0G1U6B8_9BACT|nr:MAG: hypothetical protein UX70_C0001G0337 [Candidatus Wolfebacteria bacterium GW2011_GWB1_47_1]KKU36321.1 MAG: hypothetical protein UX49_C0018G0018 [Candidatus Wolfebacteria bacterium GW2011_GWC2_46_275]KKU41873.1 MAG: hypothetical protein UX58_C0005G0023 [Candidatus Wolfebacteria bacterium GW2011_GWB2_46_69]KKU54150.1 MAG: hypothetical protein UX76_C0005G0023 [Candidatus Wolfebacteria bacterium GW2011_GWC1_47_103]KKU59073.1 MAG: hypothetical protein UX83_C0008G0023 [Candidatus Wolfebacteria